MPSVELYLFSRAGTLMVAAHKNAQKPHTWPLQRALQISRNAQRYSTPWCSSAAAIGYKQQGHRFDNAIITVLRHTNHEWNMTGGSLIIFATAFRCCRRHDYLIGIANIQLHIMERTLFKRRVLAFIARCSAAVGRRRDVGHASRHLCANKA